MPITTPKPDDWDDKDDWPTPAAREAAKQHQARDDDNVLESLGKAVSAPVIRSADPDADEAIEPKP